MPTSSQAKETTTCNKKRDVGVEHNSEPSSGTSQGPSPALALALGCTTVVRVADEAGQLVS